MKGACDGGLHIPHSTRRLAGSKGEGKEIKYDAEAHRSRIFGLHVSRYMTELQEEDPDKYSAHFSQYEKARVSPSAIEEMYKQAHIRIRRSPDRLKKERVHDPVRIRQGSCIKTSKKSYTRHTKLTLQERKARVAQKVRRRCRASVVFRNLLLCARGYARLISFFSLLCLTVCRLRSWQKRLQNRNIIRIVLIREVAILRMGLRLISTLYLLFVVCYPICVFYNC